MRKSYANKLLRNTLNAYMKAVAVHDTQEVYLSKIQVGDRQADNAEWKGGIVVKFTNGDVLPLRELSTAEQNIIVRQLVKSLHDDLSYFASPEYQKSSTNG